MSKKETIKSSITFWISVITSVLVIGINIFRRSLVDVFTPFFQPMFELTVYGFFLIIIIWSLVYGLIKVKSQKIKAFVPAIINIVAAVSIFTVPFAAITLKIDFYFHLNEREYVIEKVADGKLVPNVSYNKSLINLPKKYQNLSKGGGDIIVEYKNKDKDPNVFFFTFRGIIDTFSGFAYIPADKEPERTDFNCTEILEVEKLQDKWYWLSCT